MVGLFHTLVMSCILYVLPMWSGCLSAELIGQINSLLKQAHKFGFSSTLYTVENMADVADKALFEKILAERHCLHGFLFTKKVYDCLRPRDTLLSYPAVHMNCHDAGISISDGVLFGYSVGWYLRSVLWVLGRYLLTFSFFFIAHI